MSLSENVSSQNKTVTFFFWGGGGGGDELNFMETLDSIKSYEFKHMNRKVNSVQKQFLST